MAVPEGTPVELAQTSAADAPVPARSMASVPAGLSALSATIRAELREFADLGHLQGLVRRLDELEAQRSDLRAPLEMLRKLTLELRFDTLIQTLDGVADDCPDAVAP